jgi:FkbM family methyltransferase
MKNLVVIIRKKIINFILNKIGFENMRGHWVYSADLKRNDIIVDLGANLGEFSVLMKTKFSAHPIAVEANEFLCGEIRKKGIITYNYAIHTKNEELEFYISNNIEASSLINDFEDNWGQKEKVKVEGIDWTTFIANSSLEDKIIDLLKVDIEGSEIEFINSLKTQDLNQIKQITVEFHDWLNPQLHAVTVALIHNLVRQGFLTFTDAPSHQWPVEMVFVNKKYWRVSVFKKALIFLYNKLTFLNYN